MQILIFVAGAFLILCVVSSLFVDSKKESSTHQPENASERNYDRLLKNDGRIKGNKKRWHSTVPYAKLIREMVYFTKPILMEKNIHQFPEIRIYYYEHKRNMGVYHGIDDKICIYLKNHDSIESLADTVLHEVAHHIQNNSDNKQFKLYDHYSEHYGQYNNPLEVESRKFAKKWVKPCVDYLSSMNFISYR